MAYDPPDRPSSNVVVGIDPPAAWALWAAEGPVAVGQAKDMFSAARDLRIAMAEVGIPDFRKLYAYAVERPHGTSSGNIQTLIVEAMSTGWWLRELRHRALVAWCPTAGGWRKFTGTKGQRRQAKAAAVALATMIVEMAGKQLPRTKTGKPAVDACEALCIALAVWLSHALVVKGDMAHRLIQRLELPYTGKPAFVLDTDRIFNVRHTMTLKEDQVLSRIEDQMGIYPEDDHDPWSEAGPETEGETQQRVGDAPDDNG